MNKNKTEKLIRVFKVLLTLDDLEIIKYVLESLIDDLEEKTVLK